MIQEKVDVVFKFVNKSPNYSQLLKHSIALVEYYMEDLGEIFIVGDYPSFSNRYIHVPAYPHYEEEFRNDFWRIQAVSDARRLSPYFLYMEPEYLFLQYFRGFDLPILSDEIWGSDNPRIRNYNVAAPMLVNKEMIRILPLSMESEGEYDWRSFYGNYMRLHSDPAVITVVDKGETDEEYRDRLRRFGYFACGSGIEADDNFMNIISDHINSLG